MQNGDSIPLSLSLSLSLLSSGLWHFCSHTLTHTHTLALTHALAAQRHAFSSKLKLPKVTFSVETKRSECRESNKFKTYRFRSEISKDKINQTDSFKTSFHAHCADQRIIQLNKNNTIWYKVFVSGIRYYRKKSDGPKFKNKIGWISSTTVNWFQWYNLCGDIYRQW